jgi:hypothetical protein
MTTFFIDLWQDLREKRLWPIAVGLLAATAAVPALLFKPASPPAPQPPLPTASQGPRLPVVSVDSGPVEGSDLAQFSSKNPFIPLSALQAQGGAPSASQTSASPAASPTVPPAGAGSSTPSVSQSQAGTSGGGSGTSTPSGTPTPSGTSTVRWFHYTADVKFGVSGKLKTLKGISSLKILPNSKQPVVVFMGVTTDGARALFFVADPTYTASGKGICNVSGYACRFVTLTSSRNSETFRSIDGKTTYKLQLLKINQVFFTPKSAKVSKASVSAAGNGMLGDLDATQLVPEILSLTGAGETASGG